MNLEDLDKKYILNTYAKKYVNFTKGNNATLFDDKNNNFIDFTAGIGVVSVGHGNETLSKSIYEQASNLIHTSNLYSIEPQIKLAQKISHLAKMDMAMFFANSGAEANEGAIKIARKYGQKNFENKRYKIITLKNSFHGRTITTVKATGQDKFHTKNFSPYPAGFSYDNTIDDIYTSIDNETVAVMIELVQGEGGVLPFAKKDIQELEIFLQKNKILFMVDEVQTGIYRTGEFLASNLYDIKPDIITIAKGLAGGVPIGAVLCKHKNIFEAGDHGSTFGGNYLSTQASSTVLDILVKLKKDGTLDETIVYFTKKLNEIYIKYQNLFLDEVGLGLMLGLRLKDSNILSKIVALCFEKKLLVLRAGENTLRFLPPLTITNDEIDEGFKRLDDVLANI